jgi:hypothetical protein
MDQIIILRWNLDMYILDMDILLPFLTSVDGPAYHDRKRTSQSLIPQASWHKIIYYLIRLGVLSFHWLLSS